MIKTFILYLAILATHLILVNFKILPGELKPLIIIDGIIAVLFISGLLMTVPGVKKGGENFSLRFLVMTTIQLLIMLAIIAVLAFSKVGNVKVLGYSAIALFAIFLVIQSAILIKKVNAPK